MSTCLIPSSPSRIVHGYSQWVADRVSEGDAAYLLTFVFNQLPLKTEAARIAQMHKNLETLYQRLATRFAHHPLKPSQHRKLPLWICSADKPVIKGVKARLDEVTVNGGLHIHAIMLRPKKSRFRGDFVYWLDQHEANLMQDTFLRRIHAIEIMYAPEYVTEYALKFIRQDAGCDSVLILPGSGAGRPKATDKGYDEACNRVGGASLLNRPRLGRR